MIDGPGGGNMNTVAMRTPQLSHRSLLWILPIALAASACSSDDEGSLGESGDSGESAGDGDGDGDGGAGTSATGGSGDDGGWGDGDGDSGWGDGDGDGDGGGDGDGDGDGDDGGDDEGGGNEIPPGQLTAGEWRDLDHWGFWRNLFDGDEAAWTSKEDLWAFHSSNRFPVVVLAGNEPAVDVPVILRDGQGDELWTARTDAHGRAELFDGLFDGAVMSEEVSIEVELGQETVVFDAPVIGGDDPNVIQVDEAPAPPLALDLMFVIDTTSSMGDELGYLQAELGDVIEQIQTMNGQELSMRVSVNFYRDHGDEYVVRDFPFTDPQTAIGQLQDQDFGGGGDYPEVFDLGLRNGVLEHDWSQSATSRLLFFVADAPPHLADADTLGSMHTSTRVAAEQGIRVIPVAASGVDRNTEFLMRFIDVSTGGTYVFLTDDSGIGNPHLEPTVGQYDVELLNELLIRLISESLGAE